MKRFHILHTNDLHSHFEQMTKIYTFVSKWRQKWCDQGEGGVFIDIGDHLDRVRVETEGTDGEANLVVLENTGYDVVTLGNNELLTFTKDQLKNLYQNASFQVVSCNVSGASGDWLKHWYVYEWEGIRFGFLGVTVPYDRVYDDLGWTVSEPISALRKALVTLRKKVDVVIVLSHLGIHYDRRIAEEVKGIDLIIGAHTHHVFEVAEKVEDTLIAAAGKYGEYVGHITIEIDHQNRSIVRMQGYAVSVLQEKADHRLHAKIQQQKAIARKNLSLSVGELAFPLHIDWHQESDLANLLADCLRFATNEEIALVNSGQILGNLPAGMVTKEQIHQICPHPINPVILHLTGYDLRMTLEESLLREYTEQEIRGYGFRGKILGSIAVSGLVIHYDPKREPYRKIQEIYVGTRVLQEKEKIRVASVDMLAFGVGYLHLQQERVREFKMDWFLRDLLEMGIQNPNLVNRCKEKRWYTHFLNKENTDWYR